MNNNKFKFIETEEDLEKNKNLNSKKIYIGYYSRIAISILISLSLLILSILLLIKISTNNGNTKIKYKENSNIKYRVNLKQNDIYDYKYIDVSNDKNNNYSFIANLIDKIDIDFNYKFMIDKESNLNINYEIIGNLIITDNTQDNIFYSKEYVLSDKESIKENINDKYEINKSVTIDYDYYNNLSNKFKLNYGVDTISYLNVYFKINEENTDNNYFEFYNDNNMSVKIPLSEKAIKIKLDLNEINENTKTIEEKTTNSNRKFDAVISILLMILTTIFILYTIKFILQTKNKKTKYDLYIEKILNEYDRLIVETETRPELKGKRIIKVNKFSELLDVRDNLKLPIKYYIITEHQKCNFYIDHKDEIYLLIIKEVDLEDN